MKKIICLSLVFALTIPLIFALGKKDKDEPKGKITIYTSMFEEVITNVQKELNKKFPKCTIKFVYGGTGRLEHTIALEKTEGKLGCDILMVAEPSYSIQLKREGMLHSYISKETSNLAFEYDREGYWYPVRVNNMVLAFNPARFSRTEVPNSFYNFAYDSRSRGSVSMRNPNISGTSMAALTALRDKYGYEYFDALARQRVIIEYGTSESIRKLENGEYRAIMILEESILQLREQGSKLEVIYPTDGTIMIPSNIMIINSRWSANKNTKTAEAIADWFLSKEGQTAIIAGWMHSVRSDITMIPFGSKPTNEIRATAIPVNWENSLYQKDEIINRFEANRISN
ncbi:MAG: extracellular solute-binding protein [Treponema sp.]|nr:extracellular solute-binding protein [Treponema sp.]